MMLQDHDYEAHISNTAKVSGKMEQEAMFDLHPEKFLVPS